MAEVEEEEEVLEVLWVLAADVEVELRVVEVAVSEVVDGRSALVISPKPDVTPAPTPATAELTPLPTSDTIFPTPPRTPPRPCLCTILKPRSFMIMLDLNKGWRDKRM